LGKNIATLYVNLITGSDSAAGSQSAPFETIGRALGLAASGTSFATDEIATAPEGKILVNYPVREKLSPARDITRGEISALIYQTLVATNSVEPINSPYIVSGNWETRERRTWGINNQPISPRPCLRVPHSGSHSPTLARFHPPKS